MKLIALLFALLLAFAYAAPAQDAIDTVEGILTGAFGDEGAKAVVCLQDGEEIVVDIEKAVKEFEQGGITHITQGLFYVGKALEELPTEFKACEAAEGLLDDFEHIIDEFKHPEELVVHVGKEILWHGKSVYSDITGATAHFKQGEYEPAGEQIGDMIKILFVDTLKAPAQDAIDTVEGILTGAFGDEGAKAVVCLQDGEEIVVDIEKAVKEFEQGGITHITQGLFYVGKALEEIPVEFEACEAAEGLLDDFEKIIDEFEHPKELVVHVGKEILWHGKSVYSDINGATAHFKQGEYEPAGEQIGDIIKILFMDSKLKAPAQDAIDTVEGILTGAFGDEGAKAVVCLQDGEEIVVDIEKAVKEFEQGGITHITQGLFYIGKALEEIPTEFKACEAAEGLLDDFEHIIDEFKHPEQLVVHVGTEILWHGKNIYSDINGATAHFKQGEYEPAGEQIGDIVKILFVDEVKEAIKVSA